MVPFTLDNVQNNRTSHKTSRTQPDGDVAHGAAAFVPRSRGGDRPRHNPHDWTGREISPNRCFALRWRRMLSLPVQQRGTAAEHSLKHTHAPGPTYHETMPAAEVNHIRRPLPQLIRYSPLAVSEGDPASCARLCIHSVTMRAARGSSTAQARVRGGGPAASF